ncbi:methyl-accepting chemotaxis protein [Paenibacillus arenosi]|uniref:Methyl-accepting chemotaxis protein n=1 Tax=Paenibacillus arenosi TaxID=2774142 RepID=A0ABR9B398_9BACL|nr:methyl-accepting chemotaxis protein [Paenibacillus arenosi]MBD8500830.1 methyl-accepting chemotaxis protein [Paenibacillus arenosi]
MKWKLSVRARLILAFVLILLVPSLSIGMFSYDTAKGIVQEEIYSATEASVMLLDDKISGMVSDSKSNVEFLAGSVLDLVEKGQDHSEIFDLLNRFQFTHPELASTYIGTKEGAMIQAPKFKTDLGFDPRKREWYTLALDKKGDVVTTPPYRDALTGKEVVTISRAIDNGNGVVAVDLDLKKLMAMTNQVKVGTNGYIIILDQTGKYVVHPTLPLGSEAKEVWMDEVYGQISGRHHYMLNGESKDMAYTTNEETGWKIAGMMLTEEYGEASQPIFRTTFIIVTAAVIIGAVVIFFIIRSIFNPLQRLMRAANRVSKGDLTVKIDSRSNDEFGKLSYSFDTMTNSLRGVINEVTDTSMHLSSSSQELAAASEQSAQASQYTAESMNQLAVGSETQVSNMNEAEGIVQEITVGAKQIAGGSQTVSHAALESSDMVEEGNRSIQRAIQQMESINSSVSGMGQSMKDLSGQTQKINDIVKAITGIAEQTNLLALNASIEAARAGEHGRGFAVVASEVRKLAEQSSTMAKEIAETIKHIQSEMQKSVRNSEQSVSEVSLGIEVMHEAGAAFERIEQAVQIVATQIQEVSASAQQMSVGTEEMSGYMQEVKSVTLKMAEGTQTVSATTEEQLASMQEISNSAEELSRMAERLEESISKFKL